MRYSLLIKAPGWSDHAVAMKVCEVLGDVKPAVVARPFKGDYARVEVTVPNNRLQALWAWFHACPDIAKGGGATGKSVPIGSLLLFSEVSQ